MLQKSTGPLPLSTLEDVALRPTQWLTDGALYMGLRVDDPLDAAHPLRCDWGEVVAKDGDYPKIRARSDRHVMTIGPNGSGKTRRLLLPNLYYLKNWSIVVVDPKGELFAHTAMERSKTPGHKVVLIDPFGVVKSTYPHLAKRFPCESHGFNPVSALDPVSPDFIDDAKALAEALIRVDDKSDKYWAQSAQALIKGLLLVIRLNETGGDVSLGKLRKLLGLDPQDLAAVLKVLIPLYEGQCPAVAASLNRFTKFTPENKELFGIISTAVTQTDWLDSPAISADLTRGSYDFQSLKQSPTTVYLVLPPRYLTTHGTFLRIMITAALSPLLRSVTDGMVPVLFMLDEFAQLGRMEIIKDNYALMRGYGIKLWTVWQDLNQAKLLYDDWWESFVSNAGMVQAFAPQDMTTRKYLSELADERLTWHTQKSTSGGFSLSRGGPSFNSGDSTSETHIKEPIMYPYELAQMKQGRSVLFTLRGEVLRAYFPDATALPGVRDMMAEAEQNLRP
jgi:type IV secretion system protein VirD4